MIDEARIARVGCGGGEEVATRHRIADVVAVGHASNVANAVTPICVEIPAVVPIAARTGRGLMGRASSGRSGREAGHSPRSCGRRAKAGSERLVRVDHVRHNRQKRRQASHGAAQQRGGPDRRRPAMRRKGGDIAAREPMRWSLGPIRPGVTTGTGPGTGTGTSTASTSMHSHFFARSRPRLLRVHGASDAGSPSGISAALIIHIHAAVSLNHDQFFTASAHPFHSIIHADTTADTSHHG